MEERWRARVRESFIATVNWNFWGGSWGGVHPQTAETGGVHSRPELGVSYLLKKQRTKSTQIDSLCCSVSEVTRFLVLTIIRTMDTVFGVSYDGGGELVWWLTLLLGRDSWFHTSMMICDFVEVQYKGIENIEYCCPNNILSNPWEDQIFIIGLVFWRLFSLPVFADVCWA